ncbi:uncharacterized protein EDB93DRAFT_1252992 [Suillus bovinus]|uniref:uncharacterized protein n=1 Tax=Suillus bovinus TaxID=48563 RepID=UPI001B8610B0|nr:uncharacterized protein EDB93DRAFT_1252992 [Suillus bovinus]KAG2139871.1 hypothetical protein EDB93DRAFT_1252992 [Suillus bovinus]
MSTPVDTSLTGLKEITAKIMAIITGARQLPPGHSHFSLTTQVSTLVADVVRRYGSGPYLPGLVCSVLNGVNSCMGHDSSGLALLAQHQGMMIPVITPSISQVVASPSIGPIPVDLPPWPVIAGPSTNPASESREKGKALPSQPPKSTMKTRKQAKTTGLAKFKVFVELEDEEDSVTQRSSSPSSPQMLQGRLDHLGYPCSLKKKPFGPATANVQRSSHPLGQLPEPPVEAPPVIDAGDILIPGPNNPCQACHKMEWPCATQLDKRTGCPVHVLRLLYHQEDQVYLCERTRSKTPSKAPSTALAASQSTSQTRSESWVSSVTPGPSCAQTPKAQTHGRSKTVTAASQMPGKIVKPDDLDNLFSEYDLVECGEPSGEDVDMTT